MSGTSADGRADVPVQHVGDGVQVRLAAEQALPGQHLPQHHPQGEDVRAAVDRAAGDLLGRQVGALAPERTPLGHRQAQLAGHPGDAEVQQLHRPGLQQHDVGRADVPVDDVVGAPARVAQRMGVGQAPGHLAGDEHRQPRRQVLPGPAQRHQHLVQVAALQVLHGDVAIAVHRPEVVDLHDVRVVQQRRQPGLVGEQLPDVRHLRDLLADALDGHRPLEPLVPDRHPPPDLRHAARPDALDQPVASEHQRRGQRTARGCQRCTWRLIEPFFFRHRRS